VRSEVTIDLGAVRRNVRALAKDLGATELWAVVKANGYGHGAEDCAGAAVGSGAAGLCVATVAEGVALRPEFPGVRIVVFGPAANREIAQARDAGLELCVSSDEIPEDVRVHVKLDTGMGRWGASELPAPTREVVGVMTHLATADTDLDFAREQLARFAAATEPVAHLVRHVANSAATLRLPEARFDAVRCGIAIYGISPFGGDPLEDGLAPALSWMSELSLVKQLQPGQSAGYGRRFVADEPTWIGIVPVGYADGFRRDLEGTEVRIAGELRRVVGAVSMDAFAVELDRDYPPGTPVTIVGPGVTLEGHATHAGTIAYELACGIDSSPLRARRVLIDG
jgi:alanine racemase